MLLSALLLYHLAPGTWLGEDLAEGPEHTIVPTALQGRNFTFLENDEPQVLICSSESGGISFVNQAANVTATYVYQNIIVHALDAVLGIPGSYSDVIRNSSLEEFEAFRIASGGVPLNETYGFTAFIPAGHALDVAQPALSGPDKNQLYNNHVRLSQVVVVNCQV